MQTWIFGTPYDGFQISRKFLMGQIGTNINQNIIFITLFHACIHTFGSLFTSGKCRHIHQLPNLTWNKLFVQKVNVSMARVSL